MVIHMNTTDIKTAAILLAPGFEEIEALTPFDLLRRAGIDTTLVSVENKTGCTGTMGLEVTGLTPMKDYDFTKADALIIPGGPGYEVLEQNQEVTDLIQSFGRDKTLGAICAGSSIPGKLGLYKDRDYTVVPDLNGDFGGTFEKVHAVISGNIVTGISVGGAFEFALDLIRVLKSPEAADDIARATCWTL